MNSKIVWAVVLVVGILIVGYLAFGGDSKEVTLQDEFIAEQSVEANALAEGSYAVDTEKTVVNWEGRKTLIKDYIDRGTVAVKEGNIVVGSGTIGGNIVFDINSISATETGSGGGESALATHLRSADFFDAEKFPTATFTITSIVTAEDSSLQLVGDLTIKGITHEVMVPVTVVQENGVVMIKSLVVLDRTMWDIRYGSDKFFDNLKDNVIDDNFTVSFELVAEKVEA